MTPSVATKGGTLKIATSTPLTAPTAAPTHSVSTTTAQTGGYRITPSASSSTPCIIAPATTPDSARMEPTDRSIPPFRMTSSMPMDRMPKIATWLDMISRFDRVK